MACSPAAALRNLLTPVSNTYKALKFRRQKGTGTYSQNLGRFFAVFGSCPPKRGLPTPRTRRSEETPAIRSSIDVQGEGIVGPLGRRTTWWGWPFPARWAGLGEWLALWAASRVAVRGALMWWDGTGWSPGAGNDQSFSRGGLPPVGADGCLWGGTFRPERSVVRPNPMGQPIPQPGSQP